MGNAELSSVYRNDNFKFKVMNYFDSSNRLISNHLIKGNKEVSIKAYISNGMQLIQYHIIFCIS